MIHTIVFFGRSGSGKGTQAKLLKEYLEKTDPEHEVLSFETGKELRKLAEQDTVAGRLTKGVLESGGLMPTMLVVWLWGEYFMNEVRADKHLILDGVARRVEEAPQVHNALKFFGRENPTVVYMNASYDWCFARLKERGREDDSNENIKKRLAWFDENVMPSIEFFREKGKIGEYNFIDLNAERSIEEVQEELQNRLHT